MTSQREHEESSVCQGHSERISTHPPPAWEVMHQCPFPFCVGSRIQEGLCNLPKHTQRGRETQGSTLESQFVSGFPGVANTALFHSQTCCSVDSSYVPSRSICSRISVLSLSNPASSPSLIFPKPRGHLPCPMLLPHRKPRTQLLTEKLLYLHLSPQPRRLPPSLENSRSPAELSPVPQLGRNCHRPGSLTPGWVRSAGHRVSAEGQCPEQIPSRSSDSPWVVSLVGTKESHPVGNSCPALQGAVLCVLSS